MQIYNFKLYLYNIWLYYNYTTTILQQINMTTQEIIKQKLKTHLPKGAIKRVAAKHNLSIYMVSKVVAGSSQNLGVLQSLLDEAEVSKKVKQRIMDL